MTNGIVMKKSVKQEKKKKRNSKRKAMKRKNERLNKRICNVLTIVLGCNPEQAKKVMNGGVKIDSIDMKKLKKLHKRYDRKPMEELIKKNAFSTDALHVVRAWEKDLQTDSDDEFDDDTSDEAMHIWRTQILMMKMIRLN